MLVTQGQEQTDEGRLKRRPFAICKLIDQTKGNITRKESECEIFKMELERLRLDTTEAFKADYGSPLGRKT